jgi:hypothetical protein
MTDLYLRRSEVVALVDRLDAAHRDTPYALGFASAAAALRDALQGPGEALVIALTEDEVTYVVRAALRFGTGRPVA